MSLNRIDGHVLLPEDLLADAHLFELHLIASERPRLVCEDVVQLAQVFNDAHVLHLGALVLLVTKHLGVSHYEPRDEELDHLGRDEKRNRDERVEQLEVAHEGEDAFNQG